MTVLFLGVNCPFKLLSLIAEINLMNISNERLIELTEVKLTEFRLN